MLFAEGTALASGETHSSLNQSPKPQSWRLCPPYIRPAKIQAVTLGSNFTARIFCQVRFCRCKISGFELVFSVVDLDFRAAYQLIDIKPQRRNLALLES